MNFIKEEAGFLAYFLLMPVFLLGCLALTLSLGDEEVSSTVYAAIGGCIVCLLLISMQLKIVGIQYDDELKKKWAEEAKEYWKNHHTSRRHS